MRHGKPVKAWLAEHVEQMEVFHLPSVRPERHPEERLNADLKHVIPRKGRMRTQDTLRTGAEDHMTVVAHEPQPVKADFRDPRVKYAAYIYLGAGAIKRAGRGCWPQVVREVAARASIGRPVNVLKPAELSLAARRSCPKPNFTTEFRKL